MLASSEDSTSVHIPSIDLEMDEVVNEHYTTQPSTSFVELQPSAPGEPLADLDLVFGQFLTVDTNPGEHTETSLHTEEVVTPAHIRSPSLSKAFDRVRESIAGVSSQFECPVCFEEMKPPLNMYQCRQGHVVCEVFRILYSALFHRFFLQNCKNEGQLTVCPSCRGSIVGRNFAMEKLAEEYFKSFNV